MLLNNRQALYGANIQILNCGKIKMKKQVIVLGGAVLFAFAPPASAELSCDAIAGEAPLYADQIEAFGQTLAPPGCDMAWSQAMRARRNVNLSDGIVLREETWGLLVEERADDCTVNGEAIETGTLTRLAARCETRYQCVDGIAEVTTETSCERAP